MLVSRDRHTFFAPCPRGLEPLLCAELVRLGAQDVAATQGGVGFTGPFDLCYRANLDSRLASRILWRIGQGAYTHEQDLYQAALRLPWPDWFPVSCTIKVKVSAKRCPLKSLDFVTLRIKDAVCDAFKTLTADRPTVETATPDIRIDAFLDDTHCTFYLDTSGEALFKRGWRRAGTEAPLRENLAAGILQLAGWTSDHVLLDPMCGGGTILQEAAMVARRISPGLGRRFAFEKLRNFSPRHWQELCAASRAQQTKTGPLPLYGSDRDGAVLRAARANLEAIGLADAVHLQQADVLDLTAPAAEGLLITNPPYGVRLGDDAALAAFYPKLGDLLKQRFSGWRAYILTADLRLPKLIGLAPSRRTPLFNGALECRLYEFKLVAGSMRRKGPERA
ncbi:MAG: class I SAM-dependent RNA methyltransferase [Nitrospirota bacterium]|nr:class I SAM-dependent RNA methyltransferase [Nitrospirota bacterium]